MTRKSARPAVLIAVILLGLLALAAIVVFLAFAGSSGVPFSGSNDEPPQVFILQPLDRTLITSGQGLTLSAYAITSAGLSRVDFLVDGQVEQQFTPDAALQEAAASFHWFSSAAGEHRLSVIAYDLRARPSAEAAVQVNVQAAGALPPLPIAGEDGAPAVEPPAGEQAPPVAQPGEAPPAAGDGLPPQPQDAPPTIDRFDVSVDLDANGVMTASLRGMASDDLGLHNILAAWHNDLGEAGDTGMECAGAQSCQLEAAVALGPGSWVFSFQARDSSGQSSAPSVDVVEVLVAPGLPPAAAEHDQFNDWLDDWLLPGSGDPVGHPGFDFDDFMDDLFGMEQAAGEAVQADGRCLSIAVEPRQEGNLVTITILCPLQVDGDDRIVLPYVGKEVANTGDGGIGLFIGDWYDDHRTSLAPGTSFSWLDHDVTCGASYRYDGRVDAGHVLDYAHPVFSSVALGGNLAFASAAVKTADCGPGALGDVNLRTGPLPDGVHIHWDTAAGQPWPADLPAEGVTFILTRFDPASEQTLELYHQNVPADRLRAGMQFDVDDRQVQCGDAYWYSLAAIAADADLGLVSPGWLLRAEVLSPALPCAAQDLGSIPLQLTPYWLNESFVRVRLQMQLPAGFAWPQGEHVSLEILRVKQGEDRCEAAPCRANWQVKKVIPITDDIRQNGLDYSDDDASVNFGNYTYVYRLALVADGQELAGGPSASATTPPAPPPPPEIDRITLSNNCPNGAARCVIVEWHPYESPQPGGYYAPAASIAVERVVGALDQRYFPVGRNDTLYYDLNPFVQELHLVNGEFRRICIHETLYRMVAFDAEGHTFGASPLSVLTPDCDAPWNVIVQAP